MVRQLTDPVVGQARSIGLRENRMKEPGVHIRPSKYPPAMLCSGAQALLHSFLDL